MSGMTRSVSTTDGASANRGEPFKCIGGKHEFHTTQRFQELADQPAVKRRVVHDQNRGRLGVNRLARRAPVSATL